jgi:hypothetical protein
MAAQTIGIRKFAGPHAGRTMLVEEPHLLRPGVVQALPRMVKLVTRDASSAPTGTRLKAQFRIEVDGEDVALPIANATVGLPGAVVEFRLEMS